jgi:diguanylate cyclase (GGDEF)-like protein
VFHWIKQFGSKSPMQTRQTPHHSNVGLSIRRSLLLGFGAMAFVMLLATFISLFSTARVSKSMEVILDTRLPEMMQTLRVAKAVDALAATGVSLASARTENVLNLAFQRFENAVAGLEKSLNTFDSIPQEGDDVRRLAAELTENIRKLSTMAEQRVAIQEERQLGRERLFSNLQIFKQHLTYRVRIVEGDNDVIGRLLSQPSPPIDRIIEMTQQAARWTPVQRFYTEVETITGRVLAAVQDPTLTALALSRQILKDSLIEADLTCKKLPSDIHSDLDKPFAELQEIVLGETGLLALRKRELMLEIESQNLISENHRITRLFHTATSELVQQELSMMTSAGQSAEQTRKRYAFILLFATGFGLLAITALMHFYVLRHVILRLSWLSEAMQAVAAGKLDAPLPPAGDDELGRLGFAVRQFQKTAVAANQREAALRLSNQKVEKVCAELEQNAQELETVNSKLEELSVTDFLTGLANRRRFDEILGIEWARALRTGQPLALIMIDIDHFKKFNDSYGHQAGDECLKKVADTLTGNLCRAGDFAARYGGEEFSIISAGTHLAGALELAEKIRRAVQAMSLKNEDTLLGIVTISLGVAVCIPDRNQSATDIVGIADKALYQAKARGRNRIEYFDEPPKEVGQAVDLRVP